jgi:hypothetical protein
MDEGPRITPINDFIEEQLVRIENLSFEKKNPTASFDELDSLFREILFSIWHGD